MTLPFPPIANEAGTFLMLVPGKGWRCPDGDRWSVLCDSRLFFGCPYLRLPLSPMFLLRVRRWWRTLPGASAYKVCVRTPAVSLYIIRYGSCTSCGPRTHPSVSFLRSAPVVFSNLFALCLGEEGKVRHGIDDGGHGVTPCDPGVKESPDTPECQDDR
ncbi:unknown [Prevotella sp. CAG:924]|nr:unknown [Prevotella sp. CAG:924]